MTSIKKKVGDRIRQLRNEQKLSQEDMANEAQMARGFVSGVENGKRNITVETLGKILEVLKISLTDFFNDESFESEKKIKSS